jgi:cell division protease FtsH
MVATYGMSDELGLMAPVVVENQYLEGGVRLDCSNETYALIDTTVKKMLQASYEEATGILTTNRALLDEIAEYLLLKETITGEELMAFVNADKKEQAEETPEETTEE